MTSEVFMARMTWPEYQQRVERGAVVFLPVGATEQHGPHMAMGVDHLLPSTVAAGIARRIGGIVAPAVNYGYKSQPRSGGGNHFIGTTSLDGDTLAFVVRDILAEFARHGALRVVIVNGHYENTMFTVEGIDLALRRLRAEGVDGLKVMRLDYFEFTTPETLAKVFPDGFPGWALEHAAVFETSLMLHLHPDHVHMDRLSNDPAADFPPYDVYPTNVEWVPPSGVLSPAQGATAEKGKLMMDEYVDKISQAIPNEFGLT